MKEIGIDISGHQPKSLDTFNGVTLDLAVTLCDNAHAVCPVVPSAKKTIHHGFPDPHLTPGTGEEILGGYRRCPGRHLCVDRCHVCPRVAGIKTICYLKKPDLSFLMVLSKISGNEAKRAKRLVGF